MSWTQQQRMVLHQKGFSAILQFTFLLISLVVCENNRIGAFSSSQHRKLHAKFQKCGVRQTDGKPVEGSISGVADHPLISVWKGCGDLIIVVGVAWSQIC